MMRRRYWIAWAAAAYLIGLITMLPASQALRWIAHMSPSLAPSITTMEASGTLWHGRLQRLSLGALGDIQDIGWRLRPLALLLGELSIETEGRQGGLRLSATIDERLMELPHPSTVTMHDLELEAGLDAPPIAGWLPLSGSGKIRAELDEIVFDPARKPLPIATIAGQISASNLRIEQNGHTTVLGGLRLELETDRSSQRILGHLTDDGTGPFDMTGELIVHPDRDQYSLNTELSLRDRTQTDIMQIIRMFGTPGPDGRLRLSHQGRLSQEQSWLLQLLGGPIVEPTSK